MSKKSRGVYFLANNTVKEITIAFLNSFRKFNPSMPLCLIPYNDDYDEIENLKSIYQFEVFDNKELLKAWDEISLDYFKTNCHEFRKLAIWEGKFDEFIFSDVDAVILRNLDPLFDYLKYADIIPSYGNQADNFKWVWEESIKSAGTLTASQYGFAGCGGFIISRKNIISLEFANSQRNLGLQLKKHMVLHCKDQPLLNLLMVTCGAPYSSLNTIREKYDLKSVPYEIWAGNEVTNLEYKNGEYSLSGLPILSVQWAGLWRPEEEDLAALPKPRTVRKNMKMKSLWMEYRHLLDNKND